MASSISCKSVCSLQHLPFGVEWNTAIFEYYVSTLAFSCAEAAVAMSGSCSLSFCSAAVSASDSIFSASRLAVPMFTGMSVSW